MTRTLVLLAVGLVAMVPFDYAVTRVIGVACLLGFVISGVFAIADPAALESDDDAVS
jgi:hypothetical protein